MSRRCIIKKYIRKAIFAYLSDVQVKKSDLLMICALALEALDSKSEPTEVE